MSTFTPRVGEPEPDEQAGISWLRDTLARLAPERGMPPGFRWQIGLGFREASVVNGPRLRQTGFQVTALDASDRAHPLTCFLSVEDVLEEELQPSVEQVLALWLDRLSISEPG